ncbi:unnamed protein product [Prunus armeniaca]|uniref:Uncharacterized protein n=1 Tax=Prunus armeniaca TaxID=36596 RepID=A0A6J5V2H2_PRUAR|nr:unnamed protein product [Prunus armeniaca]
MGRKSPAQHELNGISKLLFGLGTENDDEPTVELGRCLTLPVFVLIKNLDSSKQKPCAKYWLKCESKASQPSPPSSASRPISSLVSGSRSSSCRFKLRTLRSF